MKSFKFWQAGEDYFKTRKQLWAKFILPIIAVGIYAFVITNLDINQSIKISEVFRDFVNVQIGAVTILISFSVAIMTILVSADNKNIDKIKGTLSTECKHLNDVPLNLFQVLLSNITYSILVEVVYLVLLVASIFTQLFVSECILKILMGVNVFFIIHILRVLLESVGQMYLTFWKNYE